MSHKDVQFLYGVKPGIAPVSKTGVPRTCRFKAPFPKSCTKREIVGNSCHRRFFFNIL